MDRGMTAVITTINPPTEATRALTYALNGRPLIVIGDEQTPSDWELEGATFLPLFAQGRLPFKMTEWVEPRSYQRKNLGYLEAMRQGATPIFETDDDNGPVGNWAERSPFGPYHRVRGRDRWTNIYAMYTDKRIWPRGYALNAPKERPDLEVHERMGYAPIQQELVIGSPDVDALWRLLIGSEPFEFEIPGGPFEPAPGTWCPFNSQATWWWPEAYPLMYLPLTVPWRACDIWRSLVAQRCLWERDRSTWFHFPTMRQDRNEHDLLVDLEQEVEVYARADKLARVLAETHLVNYVSHRSNMVDCYRALVNAGLIHRDEMDGLYTWLDDVKTTMDALEEEG